MVSRKRKLEKGIKTIEEQIKLHKEKKKKAKEEGRIELEEYYEKDIARLERQKEQKEQKLEED